MIAQPNISRSVKQLEVMLESLYSKEVQSLVCKLQNYITHNYDMCANGILARLTHMYAADERFKKSIDKYGQGTAEFVSDAIAAHVK